MKKNTLILKSSRNNTIYMYIIRIYMKTILCCFYTDCGVGLGISVIRKTYNGDSEILVQDIAHGSPAHKDGRLR